MADLIFSEEPLMRENIFKFEERLQSQANRYVENGGILTTYYNQDDDSTTVDRGTRDIDQLFGSNAPIRFNKINNFPIYGFGQANPENTDEQQIEDIAVEGDATILPSTIVPRPYDHFIVNHLKMTALFQVTSVSYDSMKANGFYKIHYRLFSTEKETINKLNKQQTGEYHTELSAIGTSMNPILREDDYVYKAKIQKMVRHMIMSYRSMFYNERHNCFLYHNPETGDDIFDPCGSEFISKFSLMNGYNCAKVIVLDTKIRDIQFMQYYNNSVYNWLEMDAPLRLLWKFHYILNSSKGYPYSSFELWGEEVQVIQPISTKQAGQNFQEYSIFDHTQLDALMDPNTPPANEYELLIWKFIHNRSSVSMHDISLYTGDALFSNVNNFDVFLYTPIIIYIIRTILGLY